MNKEFNKKKVIIIGVAILAVLFLLGTAGKGKKVKNSESEGQVTAVQVSAVIKGTVTDYQKFGGTVTARDSVAVLPDTQGKIVEILVSAGDYVEKDQVIGRIDASRAGQTYKLSPVKSPISGTITQVNAVVGSSASPAAPFAVVQTLDDLEISFSVIERFVTKITEGNDVLVTFDAIENEEFNAYVSHVNPTLDTMTRTMSAKAKLCTEDSRVKAGMFARLNVITNIKDDVLVVPSECVSMSEDKNIVFTVVDGKAVKTVVTTGIKDGGIVEITSGLKLGDSVISVGQGLVSDGQSVKVVN